MTERLLDRWIFVTNILPPTFQNWQFALRTCGELTAANFPAVLVRYEDETLQILRRVTPCDLDRFSHSISDHKWEEWLKFLSRSATSLPEFRSSAETNRYGVKPVSRVLFAGTQPSDWKTSQTAA